MTEARPMDERCPDCQESASGVCTMHNGNAALAARPEPRTEAGRALLSQLGSRFSTIVTSSAVPSILAIEAEARAAADKACQERLVAYRSRRENLARRKYQEGWAEARAAVLAEVREGVEGLPGEVGHFDGGQDFDTGFLPRSAVLALLDTLSDGGPTDG